MSQNKFKCENIILIHTSNHFEIHMKLYAIWFLKSLYYFIFIYISGGYSSHTLSIFKIRITFKTIIQ